MIDANRKIFITHCCAKKDNSLKNTNLQVTADKLYTATPTQRFMKKCKEKGVNWAIFSDLHGVWLPNEKHEWYEKSPNNVTKQEFERLISDFDNKLQNFDEIWFYYNPGRFHPLYKKLMETSSLKDRIKVFTHKEEIQ